MWFPLSAVLLRAYDVYLLRNLYNATLVRDLTMWPHSPAAMWPYWILLTQRKIITLCIYIWPSIFERTGEVNHNFSKHLYIIYLTVNILFVNIIFNSIIITRKQQLFMSVLKNIRSFLEKIYGLLLPYFLWTRRKSIKNKICYTSIFKIWDVGCAWKYSGDSCNRKPPM